MKILKLLLLIIATATSLFLLLNYIKFDTSIILLVVAIGVISFIFDTFVEKDFERSMKFFSMIVGEAHKPIKKLWSAVKSIILILIYQFVGVDIFGLFSEIGIEAKGVSVFNAAVFTGGLYLIVAAFSGGIRNIFEGEYKVIRDKKNNYTIHMPRNWEKISHQENLIKQFMYGNQRLNIFCAVHIYEREEMEEALSLLEFEEYLLKDIEVSNNTTLKNTKDISFNNIKLIENDTVIERFKYKVYVAIFEQESRFVEVRIICPVKYKDIVDYKRIVTSFVGE